MIVRKILSKIISQLDSREVVFLRELCFNRLQSQNILSTLYMYRTQSKTEIDFVRIKESVASLYEVKSGSNNKIPKAILEFEKRYENEFLKIDKFVVNRDILGFNKGLMFIPVFLL